MEYHLQLFSSACAVPDKKSDSVIIIGGYQNNMCSGYGNVTEGYGSDDGYGYGYGGGSYYPSNKVTRYNEYGFVEELPPLNYATVYAGCSGYYDYDDNLVSTI